MATYTGSEAITVTLVSSQVDTITLTGAGTELRISQTSTTPIYIITAQPGQTPATPTVGGAGTTAIMTDYPVVLPWTGSGIVIKVISAGTGTVNFTLTNSKFAPLGDLALKADLISPTFTGIPAAPTATPGTSTTQLATTEFVTTADQLLGTYTAYTPTLDQAGAVAKTVTAAQSTQINEFVSCFVRLEVTGTGTTAQPVKIGLPVAATNINISAGQASIYDTSTGTIYNGFAFVTTTTEVVIVGDWAGSGVWGTTPSLPLGSGDVIWLQLNYKVA